MGTRVKRLAAASSVIALGFWAASALGAVRLSGAIFTTVVDGTVVNENVHYGAKTEVYLDGGPGPNAPVGAAGLPEGDYYFQVTDPSGKDLLSSDHVSCRRIHVNADGVIDEAYPGTNYAFRGRTAVPFSFVHATGIDQDHDELGAITVQLFPFDDTPNPGGVYKVWVTRVEDFAGPWGDDYVPSLARRNAVPVNGESYRPGNYHGFLPSRSKTDNYKVRETVFRPPCVRVRKFHDKNLNGVQDAGEPDVTCWGVDVSDPLGTSTRRFTPFGFWAEPAGTWTLTEDTPVGTLQTAAIVDGVPQDPPVPTIELRVNGTSAETHEVVFGNAGLGSVRACKVKDLNGNGVADPGEPGVSGWAMTLVGTDVRGDPVGPITLTTGDTGCVVFHDLLPGTYTVTEGTRSGWRPTGPTSATVSIVSELLLGDAIVGSRRTVAFTNQQLGSLCARKVFDADADGVADPGEPGLANWRMTLVGTDVDGNAVGPITRTTDATGCALFEGLRPGSYTVSEALPTTGTWLATGPTSVSVEIRAADVGVRRFVTFTNVLLGMVKACKVYDVDRDGVADPGEPTIPGWRMTLTGTNVRGETVGPITLATDASGCAKFDRLLPGTYTVTEVLPSSGGWFATGPLSVTVTLAPNVVGGVVVGDLKLVRFTNARRCTADFGTKGYWHNQNGLSEIRKSDIAFVNGLAPYASPSSYFEAGDEPFDGRFANGRQVAGAKGDWGEVVAPKGTALAEISQFLVDPNAGADPREQLAQQLLAFLFNARLRVGGVGGVIFLPDGGELDVANLVDEAIRAWRSTDAAWQNRIAALLDGLNNMSAVSFVAAGPCPVVY